MQAIILAAGMGKRLGDLTRENTKCMVRVNGVTLIERLLSQLDCFGLDRIVLVVGYHADRLKEYVASLSVSTPVVYVENPIYDRTNNIYSLYLAKDYLSEQDTLLFESDLIVEDAVIEKLYNHHYPDLALVAKFESWMDGTVVTLDDDNNIVRFVPTSKFRFEEISDYYKTVNIYKFSRRFSTDMYIPFLEAYSKALGDNEYYEQVLRVITMLDAPSIKALPLDGEHWYEIDDVQDLDIAESIFASRADSFSKIMSRYGGYWRYAQMLDFCYLVNPYFPNERLIAEMKANFERLMFDYPSGLKVNSLLAAKYFHISQDNIVVGNGAAELIKALTESLEGELGVIRPTFEEYPNRMTRDRVVEMHVDTEDLRYDVDAIIQFFSDHPVDNLLLVNPDNPSGNFISRQDMMRLICWSKEKGVRLIVDESFVDFATDTFTLLCDSLLCGNPHLVVVKSISKSYGVPGIRLGVLATSDSGLLSDIKRRVSIWNINSYAEFYMQIFGKYESDYQRACVEFRNERERFMSELSKIGSLRILPSEANYFLCEILSKKMSSRELCERMFAEHNILLKDCSSKCGGRNFIRIAVRNTQDNELLTASLKDILR